MKQRLSTQAITTICTLILIIACKQDKDKIATSNKVSKQPGELVPIDFKDTNYHDLQLYAKDTLTNSGWTIKYLIKDDDTKYKDIHIQCSKGNLTGTFHGEDVLQLRRYFIPTFVGETNAFIYFTHGCATDCSALLVFSKDSTKRFKDFMHIVDYNINLNQVLCMTDSCYENEDKIYDLALFDLNKDKTHKITYNNICSSVYKPSCIDTVVFNKTQVTIKTTLQKSIENEKIVKQTKTIKL